MNQECTANRDMMQATAQAIAEDIAYQAALDTSNAALKVYQVAVQAYRNRTIGDAEFIAAQDIYRAAEHAFDLAFAAIANG